MKLKDTIPIIIILISIYGISQPTQVKDIYNGSQSSSPQNLYAYNGLVYFSAWDASGFNSPGGVNLGRELWVSDGTSGGTVLLKDLRPGSNGSFPRFFLNSMANYILQQPIQNLRCGRPMVQTVVLR